MEGQQDKNHKAPQIPESQTGRGFADFLGLTATGLREAVRRTKLEFIRRPVHRKISRGGRAIRRIGGSALASDDGAAALAGIIVA